MTYPAPRNRMTPRLPWANAPPPATLSGQTWSLVDLRDLTSVRRQAREFLARGALPARRPAEHEDAVERAVTALDELASNALRHGRPPASVELSEDEQTWLIVAVDAAPTVIPVPATNRPGEHGGFGMYLIADFAISYGIHVTGDRKQVWARVPRG